MEAVLNSKKYRIEEEEKKSSKFIGFFKESYYSLYKLFANSKLLNCVKSTVVLLLPILILGFIATVLNQTLGPSVDEDGVNIYDTIVDFTFNKYTLFFTIILAYKYMKDKITSFPVMLVVISTAVLGTMIVSSSQGGDVLNFGIEYILFGVLFVFFSVNVFHKLLKKKKTKYKIYTTEAQKTFHLILTLLVPILIVIIPAIALSALFAVTKTETALGMIAAPFKFIFNHCTVEWLNAAILAFASNVGRYFGLGLGTDFVIAEAVGELEFSGILRSNFNLYFVNVPLVFGFAIALLIFGRSKKDKAYGGISVIPASLNCTQVVTYGVPIMFNPLALIPCIFVPIITSIVSYFMCSSLNIEIANYPNNHFLFIGYNAYQICNDNTLGIIVQFVSITISFLCFIPFVLLNNYAKNRAFKENIKDLYPKYIEAKSKHKHVTIFDFDFELGETAKELAIQLMKDIDLMKVVREKVIEFNNTKDSYSKEKDFEIKKRELLDKLKKQLKIKSYFQPIVGASHVGFDENGKPVEFEVRGMECLMRWWYDGNYVIPPLAIEIARTCGLEYEINSYLWENMLINVDRKKCKTYITFNISMDCLEKDSFVSDIEELFNRYDMDPNGFVIEITEEDEFKNEENALKKICELKEKGFVFAIDDYGAGQTSMKYFSTNAFELVKIDGDLVKKAKENEQVYDIIGNIKDLGKRSQKYSNIQFKVLCEFIEDKDSFERLKGLKVDYYQGFLFSKAMEFDELVKDERLKLSKGSQKHV